MIAQNSHREAATAPTAYVYFQRRDSSTLVVRYKNKIAIEMWNTRSLGANWPSKDEIQRSRCEPYVRISFTTGGKFKALLRKNTPVSPSSKANVITEAIIWLRVMLEKNRPTARNPAPVLKSAMKKLNSGR